VNRASLYRFVIESNSIEGIDRVTENEIRATELFRALGHLEVRHVVDLVKVFQPDARLRDVPGLDVRVGNHVPPPGGSHILANLESILMTANQGACTPYQVHHRYESLHPFTDGNGRSGRAIWLWQMRDAPIGFLRAWYYASLQAAR
jgi:hypothetical protein